MTDNEGGPAADPGESPEPIRYDREGGDPAAKGSKRPAGAPDSDDHAAIDLDAVRDRAS